MPTILWLAILFLAQGLVIVYPGVLIFWLIVHTNIEQWRKIGRRSFWIASIGWPLTALPLLWFREEIFSSFIPSEGLFWAGVIALVFSTYYFGSAARQIPRRTLFGLAELEPQKNKQPLLQTGIYARTRNPIYFAHWLLIFAAAAMSGYVANWIFFALDSLVLPLMIRAEQKELRKRYGAEYDDYARRVPAFLPKLA